MLRPYRAPMYDPDRHHRRSIRLRAYDYTQAGAYFVTICTHGRECLLGNVVDGSVQLSTLGCIVERAWRSLARDFANMAPDAFVVMPNHLHGIVVITQGRGEASSSEKLPTPERDASPLRRPARPAGTVAGSLGAMVQNFKSMSTRRINTLRGTPGVPVWQRNYYERVIRSEEELSRVRQYITQNPTRWATDEENPVRVLEEGIS